MDGGKRHRSPSAIMGDVGMAASSGCGTALGASKAL